MNSHYAPRSFWSLGVGIVAMLLGPAATAWACSTPVYRYAMYNWPSAPYRVFYFHRGEPAEADQAINEKVNAEGEALPAAANIFVSSVDLSKIELDRLPQPVKEALEAHKDGEPPHLVFTPWGVNIFSGRLDEATIKAMVDSPARARLGKLLEQGNATVFLMLPGKDKQENARAEKEVKELIATAAAGEIPVGLAFAMPPPTGPDGKVDEDALAEANKIKVALLKVDRSDAAEQWLIRSLMEIEPDLHELADEPMVFAVYGRGRALEPYVGKGITADNLAEIVMFVADACSCMVKDMNPGSDLLMKWDWDKTAEVLAADDPSLDMSAYYGYGEYPAGGMEEEPAETEVEAAAEPAAEPETVTAAEDAASGAASAPAEAAEVSPTAEPSDSAPEPAAVEADTAAAAEEPAEPQPEATAGQAEAEAPAAPQPAQTAGQEASPAAAPARPSGSAASGQLWTYGLGLLIGAVLVIGAGFMLLRKQSAG